MAASSLTRESHRPWRQGSRIRCSSGDAAKRQDGGISGPDVRERCGHVKQNSSHSLRSNDRFTGCFLKNSHMRSLAEMSFVDLPKCAYGGGCPGQV